MDPIKEKTSTRCMSLDVFRGITIALMILVNSAGNSFSYALLDHARWNGCTLADVVFPFFIIIVGISAVLSLTKLQQKGSSKGTLFKKIVKRSLSIFVLGLLLNAFPHHFDPYSLRIPGVLQRIAICYFFGASLFLISSIRTQVILIVILLVDYWGLLAFFSSFSLENNIVGYVDTLIFTKAHLYTAHFDPEGLLSTIPALASVLLGNLAGYLLISTRTQLQKLRFLIIAGLLLSLTGWLWAYVFPFNKQLWSSSYVLWTAGLALLVFALCYALIDIKLWRAWCAPFLLFGKNALTVFILHVFFLKVQAIILLQNKQGHVNLRVYITDALFGSLSPYNASLAYAAMYTLFWLFVLWFTQHYFSKNKMLSKTSLAA